MNFQNIPDPNVDWDNIKYNSYSDGTRLEPGFKTCSSCLKLLAINAYNFNRNKRSPDGYQYICKECSKKYRKKVNTPSPCEGDVSPNILF